AARGRRARRAGGRASGHVADPGTLRHGKLLKSEGTPSAPRADGVKGQGRHAGPEARAVAASPPSVSVGTTHELPGDSSLAWPWPGHGPSKTSSKAVVALLPFTLLARRVRTLLDL